MPHAKGDWYHDHKKFCPSPNHQFFLNILYNKDFVKFGLQLLENSDRIGVRALLKQAGLEDKTMKLLDIIADNISITPHNIKNIVTGSGNLFPILSTQFIAMGAGIAFSYVVGIPLITVLGNSVIGTICFFFAVPGFIAALAVLMLKTKDTTGVDLNKVTGNEFE